MPARRSVATRSHRGARVVVILLLSSGCAAKPAPPQNPFLSAKAAPSALEVGPKVHGLPAGSPLVDSVVLLASSPDALAPAAVSRAMRELSRALQPLAAEPARAVSDVAKRLEASEPSSLAHGGLINDGLQAFLAAMLALPAPAQSAGGVSSRVTGAGASHEGH